MVSLFAVGFFSGSLLGLRYKVLVLLPAILAASVIILLVIAVIGGSLNTIAMASLDVSIALQVGYICGLGLRLALVLIRATRFQRAAPAPTSITT